MSILGVLGLFLVLIAGASDEQIWSGLWKVAWPPSAPTLFFLGAVIAAILALRKSGKAAVIFASASASALCVAVANAGAGPGYGSTANGAPLPHEYVGVGFGPAAAAAAVYLLVFAGFLAWRDGMRGLR